MAPVARRLEWIKTLASVLIARMPGARMRRFRVVADGLAICGNSLARGPVSQHLPPSASRPLLRAERVLLVDDEQPVLRALVRLIRPRRPTWELAVASHGVLAIDMLRARYFDVLVTDLNMPEVTGEALLEYASRYCPAMARVVHSGSVDRSRAEGVTKLCHAVLNKPVDPDVFVDVVGGAMKRGRSGIWQIRAGLTTKTALYG